MNNVWHTHFAESFRFVTFSAARSSATPTWQPNARRVLQHTHQITAWWEIGNYINESQEGREQRTDHRCGASHTAVKSMLKTINATNHKITYSHESEINWATLKGRRNTCHILCRRWSLCQSNSTADQNLIELVKTDSVFILKNQQQNYTLT